MENIIKKAQQFGYEDMGTRTLNTLKGASGNPGIQKVAVILVTCDPKFWQALGKACGWAKDWKQYALRFHEMNLTESWQKAVEYLESITK